MNENRIFIGSGKGFGQYGQIGVEINLDAIPEEHIETWKDGSRHIRLNICRKKDPGAKNPFFVEVNTWKPNQKTGNGGNYTQKNEYFSQNIGENIDSDDKDIPF